MELRLLTTFLKVAQLQSFSKAAESLGYSQSAVTVQVQQLENELGVRLFDRIGKTVSITHIGFGRCCFLRINGSFLVYILIFCFIQYNL